MNKPDWLVEFPFLSQHWHSIVAIQSTFPTLSSYDLDKDWLDYLSLCKKEHSVLNWFQILRHFRQSRIAYIGFMDITLPIETHVNTMHLVSELANCMIRKAYLISFEEMIQKYGHVIDKSGQQVELLVFALGKLGTNELNYSSDVDLVFLHDGDGSSNGNRSLSAADYFTRFGQRLIKLLDFFSNDGQVYRVDMRLRPFGSSGPLVCSVAAFQNYLEYEGRDWERFAWMRARQICGTQTNSVDSLLQPFIYRRHLDYQVFDALAAIKSDIANHAKAEADNIKLGVGGIRVIEFIVQSLQLVFGGRHKQLRGTELFPQIQMLEQLNKLDSDAVECITLTWLILRKVENVAQLVNDQPNHVYPENEVILNVVSHMLGYEQWDQALVTIQQLRSKSDLIFKSLLNSKHTKDNLTEKQERTVNQLFQHFKNTKIPQSRVEQVKQLLRSAIQLSVDVQVLNYFVGLIKNMVSRPAYILMLLKEPNLLQKVMVLLEKHNYFFDVLKQHPVLLELLFEYEKYNLMDEVSLASRWTQQLQNNSDVEQWMESIRYFKKSHEFNLMMSWSDGLVNDEMACQQLSHLAKFILELVVRYSFDEMSKKLKKTALSPEQLIIIAYGSAAVDSMHIGSDLDLVFVMDVSTFEGTDRIFAQKWIRRIIHHLNSPMYNGKLYELDMQLRPNGNSGALITTCAEFESYQKHEAWIWEHAALIKSKPIFATSSQYEWHKDIRKKVLTKERSHEEVDLALTEMSAKLSASNKTKEHQGEFLILSNVLKYASKYPEIVEAYDLELIQQLLFELGLISTTSRPKPIKKGPIR